MAYATTRNKALRSSWRLITGTHEGKTWYTNGYFAVDFPIFDGYKLRKADEKQDIGEKFGIAMPKLDGYEGAWESQLTEHEKFEQNRRVDDMKYIAYTSGEGKRQVVNEVYVNLVKELYPNAEPFATGGLSAVVFKEANEVVALIMPIRIH